MAKFGPHESSDVTPASLRAHTSTAVAHRQGQLPTRPVVDRATSGPTHHDPIDADEAFDLLRRWLQDQGSPSHLRELATQYKEWSAVALVLGELTAAALRQPYWISRMQARRCRPDNRHDVAERRSKRAGCRQRHDQDGQSRHTPS